MEALYRFFSGLVAASIALFAPVAPLVVCTLLFIAVDFVSGVVADRCTARREGRVWYFESRKAWHTVIKAALVVTMLAMGWLLDSCVLNFVDWHVARWLAGFTCGVELWSFLENAAQLSDAPLFRWLRRYVHRRIQNQIGDGKGLA